MGRLTRRTKDILDRPSIAVGVHDVYKYSPYYKAIDKLAHYEDMEEAGRLIEVVYGFNQYDHDSAFECSVCGFTDWDTLTADDGKYNYCPNCGAKMEV